VNRGIGLVALILVPVFFWKFFEAYSTVTQPQIIAAGPLRCEIIHTALSAEIAHYADASHILIHSATVFGPPQDDRVWIASDDWALDGERQPVWRWLHDFEPCIPLQTAMRPMVMTFASQGEAWVTWMYEITAQAEQPARIACLFLAEPEVQENNGLASVRVFDTCTDMGHQLVVDVLLERGRQGWSVVGRLTPPEALFPAASP
tara:strand:- start:7117 stop:7728 length:612 start_codon:yes stop_codon:yes gene_type:complete